MRTRIRMLPRCGIPLSARHLQLAELDPFAARQRSLDSGHKHLRLSGQMCRDGVEGLCFVPLQELLDSPFTGIVSRQGQPPV